MLTRFHPRPSKVFHLFYLFVFATFAPTSALVAKDNNANIYFDSPTCVLVPLTSGWLGIPCDSEARQELLSKLAGAGANSNLLDKSYSCEIRKAHGQSEPTKKKMDQLSGKSTYQDGKLAEANYKLQSGEVKIFSAWRLGGDYGKPRMLAQYQTGSERKLADGNELPLRWLKLNAVFSPWKSNFFIPYSALNGVTGAQKKFACKKVEISSLPNELGRKISEAHGDRSKVGRALAVYNDQLLNAANGSKPDHKTKRILVMDSAKHEPKGTTNSVYECEIFTDRLFLSFERTGVHFPTQMSPTYVKDFSEERSFDYSTDPHFGDTPLHAGALNERYHNKIRYFEFQRIFGFLNEKNWDRVSVKNPFLVVRQSYSDFDGFQTKSLYDRKVYEQADYDGTGEIKPKPEELKILEELDQNIKIQSLISWVCADKMKGRTAGASERFLVE